MSDDPVRRFFTWMLVVVGGLVVAVAGPCTTFYVGAGLFELVKDGEGAQVAAFVVISGLIVGGLPLAGGVAMLVVGLRTLKSDRAVRCRAGDADG